MKSKTVPQIMNLGWENNFSHLLSYPSFLSSKKIYECGNKKRKETGGILAIFTKQKRNVLWMKNVFTVFQILAGHLCVYIIVDIRSKWINSVISSLAMLPYGNLFFPLTPSLIDLRETKIKLKMTLWTASYPILGLPKAVACF